MPNDTRALVTGGCGFVGSHLSAELVRAGAEVAVVDDLSLGQPDNLALEVRPEVRLFGGDIREPSSLERYLRHFQPTVVLHLAAIHFIPACDLDPARAVSVNVGGTQSVLDACARCDSVQALVFASTAAVYAPASGAHDETSPIGPTDIYGHTKRFGEQLVELFHVRSGIPVRVARLFNVIGPGETNPHLIPTVLRQAEQGAALQLGNLDTRRDYVYVEDVAAALSRMALNVTDEGGLTLNVGSERAVSGHEIVEAVGRIRGRPIQVETDPSRVRKSDRPSLLSDCSRARALLGWHSTTDLVNALRAAGERPLAASVDFV